MKNKYIKIASIAIVALMILMLTMSFVYATSIGGVTIKPDTTSSPAKSVGSISNVVLGVIQVVGTAIAVGMLIYIGIKYMTKGAGAKAEVKDTLLPFLIGAMLVFFATTIAGALLPSASNFKDAKLPSETSFVEMV